MITGLPPSSYSAIISQRNHASTSPGGDYIVYHAGRGVYDDNGGQRTNEGGYPEFLTQLFVSESWGLNERALLESDVMHAQEPRWSPDGQ